MQALDDVDVISLAQIYNGPYCALMLAFMGANVVKVEPPGGETLRSGDPDEEDPRVLMLNSSKRSLELDLKTERGKELFRELVAEADVLIENFRVGTMDRLGLGYDTLSELNPELIYAHGSGFGEEGPYTEYPAMDFTVQAMSGIMDVTGYPGDPPVKAGVTLCDFLGGIHLAAGVLGALYHRERTGEGQFVEAAMLDAAYPTLTSQFGAYYQSPDSPHRVGNHSAAPDSHRPYNTYATDDGHIAIICVTERHWERLVAQMGDAAPPDDLAFAPEAERSDRMDEIDATIETWSRGFDRDELAETLMEAGIPCAPVKGRNEVLFDPHLEGRRTINEIDHPLYGEVRVPGAPIRLHGGDPFEVRPAPGAGQHSAEVLRELGLSTEEIEKLESDGVI